MRSIRNLSSVLPFVLVLAVTIPLSAQDPNYIYSVTDALGAPGSDQTVMIQFDNSNGLAIQGWSYGLCHNATEVTLLDAVQGSTTLTVKNGSPPDFHALTLFPGEGLTAGCAICFTGCAVLEPGQGYELLDVSYNLSPGAAGTLSELAICDTIGDPVVESVVVLEGGGGVFPTTEPGMIEIGSSAPFTRGDCNVDGAYDIADAITALDDLFGGGAPPVCVPACDADANDTFELDDPMYMLNNLFLGGPNPPSAGTCEDQGCVDFLACP